MKKLNKFDKMFNKFEERSGKKVKQTPLIKELVEYIHMLAYDQGYNAGKKKGGLKSQIDEEIVDSPVVKKEKTSSNDHLLPIQPKSVRLAKAEEMVGECVLFVPTKRNDKGIPLCGNICRSRDGIRVGAWSDVTNNNCIVINAKKIAI